MNSPTPFIPPQIVFSNGVITGNLWGTPNYIFLVDSQFATSDVNTGSASDFVVGNFNLNIPSGSIILGFELELIGKRGAQTSPVITLDVSAYDNTNGADQYFPYATPITSFTTAVTTVVIGSPTELFGTAFTVDMANNIKIALTANGDISLDSVLLKCYFTPPATLTLEYNTLAGVFQVGEAITGALSGATAVIVTDNGSSLMTVTNVVGFFQDGETITGGTSGATAVLDAPIPGVCIDCSSPIQVQAMYLELPFLFNQMKFYLKKGSFSYPNGIPVQPGDVGSCGGTIPFVFDESKRKMDGQNFEENAMLDTNNGGTWTVLASGVIEVDLGSVTQRGLDFKTPGGHVATNMSDHDANSKVIISNNEPYNLTLVRRCQADTVFSPPITVQDEGVNRTTSLHLLNFVGEGVTATLSALHNILATITDRFVRISVADTTSGYLASKLVAGANVLLTILNPGGNEQLQIDVTGGGMGNIISINGDVTPAQTITGGVGISVTNNGTGDHTITATGGGTGTSLGTNVNQVAHGLSVGDVIKSNGTDNQFAQAQADTPVNSEAVGIVTAVADVDNFTYVSSAVQLSGGFVPVGTPGDALFLDPAVAGGLTTTKPTAVGQIIRGLGTIIASGATMYFDIAALAEEITAGSSGTLDPENVSIFDDFVSATLVTSKNGGGQDTWDVWGNWVSQLALGQGYSSDFSELNHPGIVRISQTGFNLKGFVHAQTMNSIGPTFDNDFDITILNRLTYSTPGVGDVITVDYKLTNGIIYVRLNDNNGVQTVSYDIGGGLVGTAVPFPVSTTWFKIRFTMVSGVYTAYLDSNVIYTGSPGFTGMMLPEIEADSILNAATLDLDVDYVLTNYNVTR